MKQSFNVLLKLPTTGKYRKLLEDSAVYLKKLQSSSTGSIEGKLTILQEDGTERNVIR